MEFNTKLCKDLILEKIKKCVHRVQQYSAIKRRPIKLKDIRKLRLSSNKEKELTKFVESFDHDDGDVPTMWQTMKGQCCWTSSVLNSLTLSQTTNFRLSKTERACRRQFQIWWKWQKLLQKVRKHCGKRRNCSLRRAISPFSHSVFKRLLLH